MKYNLWYDDFYKQVCLAFPETVNVYVTRRSIASIPIEYLVGGLPLLHIGVSNGEYNSIYHENMHCVTLSPKTAYKYYKLFG